MNGGILQVNTKLNHVKTVSKIRIHCLKRLLKSFRLKNLRQNWIIEREAGSRRAWRHSQTNTSLNSDRRQRISNRSWKGSSWALNELKFIYRLLWKSRQESRREGETENLFGNVEIWHISVTQVRKSNGDPPVAACPCVGLLLNMCCLMTNGVWRECPDVCVKVHVQFSCSQQSQVWTCSGPQQGPDPASRGSRCRDTVTEVTGADLWLRSRHADTWTIQSPHGSKVLMHDQIHAGSGAEINQNI